MTVFIFSFNGKKGRSKLRSCVESLRDGLTQLKGYFPVGKVKKYSCLECNRYINPYMTFQDSKIIYGVNFLPIVTEPGTPKTKVPLAKLK